MNRFPYTNFHDINLDWIIKTLKQIITKLENLPSGGGGGGGGTDNYNDLNNKPQINGVTLSGNKTTSQLGISVPSPYTSNPAALGTASPGSSANYSRGDHVHQKPIYSKSDVGLGNVDNVQQYSASNPPPYPVTSVNTYTGSVVISASDTGAIELPENASEGDFLVYTATGWDAVTLAEWQGGNY